MGKVRSSLRKIKFYAWKACKFLKYSYVVRKKKYVLIDTPTHANIGDHAIALAEQQILAKVCGKEKVFELTADDIDGVEKIIARVTPSDKVILVHGGGFLGVLWPEEEMRFRRILEAFNKHKIIVCPQTVTFDLKTIEGKRFFNTSKKLYTKHDNLTIFVRESKSYEFMERYMPEVPVILVPDVVTTLSCMEVSGERQGVLLCMRSDLEKDISDENFTNMLKSLRNNYGEFEFIFTDMVSDKNVKLKDREDVVRQKLLEFAKSKLVITDRLHGMVFAAITNTPCIALNNSNGKVHGVYNWIKENEYIKCLEDPMEISNVINEINLEKNFKYSTSLIDKAIEPFVEMISACNM